MPDYTYLTLIVADCPPDQADAVLDVISRYGLRIDGRYLDTRVLECGVPYAKGEAKCGTVLRIADELVRRAPGASWSAWEDPNHGMLGTLRCFTPELGEFTHACDDEGVARFTPEEIEDLIGLIPDMEAYELRIGRAHSEALEAFDDHDVYPPTD